MRKIIKLSIIVTIVVIVWDDKNSLKDKDLEISWGDTFPTKPIVIPYEKIITNRDTTPYKGNWVDVSN